MTILYEVDFMSAESDPDVRSLFRFDVTSGVSSLVRFRDGNRLRPDWPPVPVNDKLFAWIDGESRGAYFPLDGGTGEPVTMFAPSGWKPIRVFLLGSYVVFYGPDSNDLNDPIVRLYVFDAATAAAVANCTLTRTDAAAYAPQSLLFYSGTTYGLPISDGVGADQSLTYAGSKNVSKTYTLPGGTLNDVALPVAAVQTACSSYADGAVGLAHCIVSGNVIHKYGADYNIITVNAFDDVTTVTGPDTGYSTERTAVIDAAGGGFLFYGVYGVAGDLTPPPPVQTPLFWQNLVKSQESL